MISLGLKTVATPGTPVQMVATSTPMNAMNFQPMKGTANAANVGPIYIGNKNMVKSTLVGVFYVLAPGQPATTVRPWSADSAENDDASNYWMDADNANDGALVSYS